MRTLLLVEDNPDDADLIRHGLRRAQIRNPVQLVTDGRSAVDYLEGTGAYRDREKHPVPGLILLDLKLPRMSGFEVLAWARANPATRRLPIVVLTSSDQNDDIERAYDLAANSYLVKPVSVEALQNMVRSLGEYWLELNQTPGLA